MEERNKKLRLLVTTDCPNHCPLCCNNRFDFDKIPVVDRWDYDEIMITGGEPMLFPDYVRNLIIGINTWQDSMGMTPSKIYIYTARIYYIVPLIPYVNGIVYTPHNRKDVEQFVKINGFLLKEGVGDCSLRLNLFSDIKAMLPEDIDLHLWKVKDMEWIKDCPIPEGEDFRRIAKLWAM